MSRAKIVYARLLSCVGSHVTVAVFDPTLHAVGNYSTRLVRRLFQALPAYKSAILIEQLEGELLHLWGEIESKPAIVCKSALACCQA
jgi:hypothetical protein